MLVLAPPDGGLVSGELRELVELLNPKRGRLQARDFEATAATLRDLRSLALVLPDDTAVTLFNDIRGPADPATAKPGHVVEWSLSRAAQSVVAGESQAVSAGRFLFNFTGAMRLSANESAHLRAYLHAAAAWNNAHPPKQSRIDPERLPALTVEEWGARFNLLSAAAVEGLQGAHGRQQRKKLSEDRIATMDTIDKLADEHRLILVEKVGREAYRLLPPPALEEAYTAHRTTGRRPA